MKNPEISIVIPVYNGSKTLGQCLNSVLKQTYGSYEIIVVDNNSTDNTGELIRKFAEENARVVYVFEGKRGRGSARNAGINASRGTIIAMTDSDCVVGPDWLEKISRPIIDDNEKVVVGSEENIFLNYWTNNIQEANGLFVELHRKEDHINSIDTKNFAILSDIIKEHRFDENIRNLEDFDLALRLKRILKIRFAPDIKVGHYHKSSMLSWAKLQTERGYWAYCIYRKHINETDIGREEMFQSISIKNFAAFHYWLIKQIFDKPAKKLPFIFISEIFWRMGLLIGLTQRFFKKLCIKFS